jgi:hypothetical protein
MALTFLCAGCSQAERDEAEATVKAALGDRYRAAPWSFPSEAAACTQ